MDRRVFLKTAKLSTLKIRNAPEGAKSVLSGITPYSGAWTSNEVAHLLKRTLFGAKKQDIDYFLTMTMSDAVYELMGDASAVSPPVRDYGVIETINGMVDDSGVTIGNTWINDFTPVPDPGVKAAINSLRIESLRKWWAGLMINQNRTIWEKMVLFWHHHYSVQREEVENHIAL